jgi:hypothetical protein
MLQKPVIFFFYLFFSNTLNGQALSRIDSARMGSDIKLTIDRPDPIVPTKKTVIVFYALPNGNTTAQTMGKPMQQGDDWHYDIQHIKAQTDFIRAHWTAVNFIVIYLENDYKSWPSWKQKHPDFRTRIPALVDSVSSSFGLKDPDIYLNGHSGGGSFIFGYLAGVEKIPASIKRISFLDSNYGYDSSYYPKLSKWLHSVKGAVLNVFAYNDSIALYNGKPFVSATGGTWWRSHHMLRHFATDNEFNLARTDSLMIYKNSKKNIQFFFKLNFNRGIYHTQQVELNGFIHSVFCGTGRDSKAYKYYGARAYREFIR